MELSSTGRLFVWLAVALSIFGVIFTNPAALGIAIIVSLYMLYEGLSFRHITNGSASFLDSYTTPPELETRVTTPVNFVTTITNKSKHTLLLLDATRTLPDGVSENRSSRSVPYALKPHAHLSLRTEILTKNPGTFNVSKLKLTLGSRRTLFLDHIVIKDRFRIIAKPLAIKATHPVHTDNLTDMIHDETRRGTGTDFAGLRPATYLDNYRMLDWKAVARFGKLYTREFYLDEEPAIMLMVDISIIAGPTGGTALEGLYELVSNLRGANPLGLIVYDSSSIITTILPGLEYKERILHALLRNSGRRPAEKGSLMPQVDFVNELHSLSRLVASDSATKLRVKRLGLFARTILPFYSYARSKRLSRLRSQGSYLAFDAISSIRDPVLVISIADEGSDLQGLMQGARRAVTSNHRVILILLSFFGHEHQPQLSGRISHGVTIARAAPKNLLEVVSSEIMELGRARNIRVDR